MLTFETGGQVGVGRDHDEGVRVALGEEVPLPRLELGDVIASTSGWSVMRKFTKMLSAV